MHVGLGIHLAGAAVTAEQASYSESTSLYYSASGATTGLAIGDVPELRLEYDDPWTIEFWVKMGTPSTSRMLWGQALGSSTLRGTLIWIDSSNRVNVRITNTWSTNVAEFYATSGVDFTVWTHVAVKHDGTHTVPSGYSILIDGVAVAFTTSKNTLSATVLAGVATAIGYGLQGGPTLGKIGSSYVYDSALSDATILEHASKSTPYDHDGASGLLGGWRPDDLSGTTIADLSGNGNDATMGGGMVAANQALDSPFVWTPPSFTTKCVAWWRGDLGITLNGSDVSAWADQTGKEHAATQGTAANQPAYDATEPESLDVEAANLEYLSVAGLAETSNDYTIFVVMHPESNSGYMQMLSVTGNATPAYFYQNNTAVANNVAMYDNSQRQGFASTTALQYVMFEVDSSTPDITFRRNGDPSTDVVSACNATMELTGVTNLFRYVSGGFHADGKYYEMLVYNGLLTAPQKSAVESYLDTRYGL